MFSHWENTKLKHATLNTALFLQKALTLDHKDRERPMESLGHRDASSLLFFFFFVWQVRTIRLAAKLRVAPAFEAAQDRPSQYFIERCKHIVSCWGRSCANLNTLSKWAGFQVGVEEEHKKNSAVRKWPRHDTVFKKAYVYPRCFEMQENFVRTSHLLNTPALRVALCRASVSGAFRSAPGPPLWCHNSHVSGCSGNINEGSCEF